MRWPISLPLFNTTIILFTPIIAFLIAFLLLQWMVKRAAHLPQDHPNDRSLHVVPVPRTGGIALMGGWLLSGLFVPQAWLVLAISIALMTLSLIDDWRGL